MTSVRANSSVSGQSETEFGLFQASVPTLGGLVGVEMKTLFPKQTLGKESSCFPRWFPGLLERSRPTPRASPSLIQSTMPLYSGMAQSSVTGCPAITTWSCGCCVNDDAWPGQGDKERNRSCQLSSAFQHDEVLWDATVQGAPGTAQMGD